MTTLLTAIVDDDASAVKRLLKADVGVATRRIRRPKLYNSGIFHWIYVGATPLHRAVRTRCAAAVKFLLSAGGDPTIRNKSGSTPFHLAVQNTGRGGSGAQAAIDAQREIIKTFLDFGVSPNLKNGSGKTV